MCSLKEIGEKLSTGVADFAGHLAELVVPICDALMPGDCPCCGAPARIESREKKRETQFAIMCSDPDCLLRTAWTAHYPEALKSWNRRPTSNEKDNQKRG